MKIVVNNAYGGFSIPSDFPINCDRHNDYYRVHPRFIEWVKEHPWEEMAVIEIPDEAIDWEISEYDGLEHIIAVIDGKLRHIYPKY